MRAVFLQVRLESSRLFNKALLPLAGHSVYEHTIRALSGVQADLHCILTTQSSVKMFQDAAKQAGWQVFVGSQDDVLSRFVLAGRQFGVKTIIRATGDNPLVDAPMADMAVQHAENSGAHYVGFSGLPLGCGVEVLDFSALEQAFVESQDSFEREHVSPFLYRNPHRFRIERPSAPAKFCLPDARVTLDTPDDYEYLKILYADLYKGFPPDLNDLVSWLKDHPFHAS